MHLFWPLTSGLQRINTFQRCFYLKCLADYVYRAAVGEQLHTGLELSPDPSISNNNNNIYFSIAHMSLRLKALNNKRLQFKI